MGKSLLFRLFGWGAIPRELRPVLAAEQVIVADEGLRGWLISRNVKGPRKRFRRRAEGFSGCLVITKKRIVCFTYGKRQINIPVDHPKISEIFIKIPEKDILSISFESSAFRQGWNGIMEFQFKTERASEFHEVLRSLGARQGTPEKGSSPSASTPPVSS